MTKKDYELIAKAIRRAEAQNQLTVEDVLSAVRGELADALATTNPRFDRDCFIKACTTGGEK